MFDFHSLLPAPACVICGKALNQIGGRRITAQKTRGMSVGRKPWTNHDRENLLHTERLVNDQPLYLNVWGKADVWTPEVIDRIRNTYLRGLRPWFCQADSCGNRQCPECGCANNLPVGSDLLYDDGRNPHLMFVPSDCGCVNRNCSKFREFGASWEVVQIAGDGRKQLSTS